MEESVVGYKAASLCMLESKIKPVTKEENPIHTIQNFNTCGRSIHGVYLCDFT